MDEIARDDRRDRPPDPSWRNLLIAGLGLAGA